MLSSHTQCGSYADLKKKKSLSLQAIFQKRNTMDSSYICEDLKLEFGK